MSLLDQPGRCFRAELKRASADMTRCMWRDRDSVSFWSQPQRLDIGCDHIEVISEGHNRWFACAQLNSLPFAIARAGRAVLHATCTPRNMHTTAPKGRSWQNLASSATFSDQILSVRGSNSGNSRCYVWAQPTPSVVMGSGRRLQASVFS